MTRGRRSKRLMGFAGACPCPGGWLEQATAQVEPRRPRDTAHPWLCPIRCGPTSTASRASFAFRGRAAVDTTCDHRSGADDEYPLSKGSGSPELGGRPLADRPNKGLAGQFSGRLVLW